MNRITRKSPRQGGYGSTSSLRNDSLKHTWKHERKEGGIEPGTKLPRAGRLSGKEGRTVRIGHADSPTSCRGQSARAMWTIRLGATDSPLKSTEPPETTQEKRTVREDQADRPRGIRTVRYWSSDWISQTVQVFETRFGGDVKHPSVILYPKILVSKPTKTPGIADHTSTSSTLEFIQRITNLGRFEEFGGKKSLGKEAQGTQGWIPQTNPSQNRLENENQDEHENSTKMTPKNIMGTTMPNLLYKPGKIHKV
jgi:hypothetical protein